MSWLLSFVLVLTLALSFSFPSCAGAVGSSSKTLELKGPVIYSGIDSPSGAPAAGNDPYSNFTQRFSVSSTVPLYTWNGNNPVSLGPDTNYEAIYLNGSLNISSKYEYLFDSSLVLTQARIYVEHIYFLYGNAKVEVPFTSSDLSVLPTIYYGCSLMNAGFTFGDLWNDTLMIQIDGIISGTSTSVSTSNNTYFDSIYPLFTVKFVYNSSAIWLNGYNGSSISDSDLFNQTNSINNNINQAMQNQTNSINNNINQATQNQTNSINNNINQATQNQTNTLTGGYDNSGMESTNKQLADSLASYDQTESQVTDQSVAYIDAVSFFDPTTHLQLMTSITYVSTFLQNLFVSLGDWSVLVMISLSLAFALMLIGWFKYRK